MNSFDNHWIHNGYDCYLRHGVFNAPCGYVAIPEDHPLYEVMYDDYEDFVNVHGGVTFTDRVPGIDGWLVGFDMAHAGDFDPDNWDKCIRTDAECMYETNHLADVLKSLNSNK